MFDDLEDDFDSIPNKKCSDKTTYPCIKCGGTGKYQGARIRQTKDNCFACQGRGHFVTSPQQRDKARHSAAQSRADKVAKARLVLKAKHPDVIPFLTDNASWSDYYQSLLNQVNVKGELSELKKPKLVFGGLAISIAPASGKNAGCLYVKDNGEYAGKITAEGKYLTTKEAREEIQMELMELAKDPLQALIKHGRMTGNCACCGRELKNKKSIEMGIGPVCARKWGLI